MALFRRRKRIDLGTYVAPAPKPLAPLDDLVDEGAMIVASTVRMAVKNLIIISALRDGRDFDEDAMLLEAQSELLRLAAEKREDAVRIGQFGEQAEGRFGKARHQTDYHESDIEALDLRGEVSLALADRLDELSRDEAYGRDLVEKARDSAFAEFASSVEQRLAGTPQSGSGRDPKYRTGLAERKRLLVTVDLAELERASIPEY
ncbi:hypothetical protein BH11ACT3_BH11ACT3_02410 [soil metagenome]